MACDRRVPRFSLRTALACLALLSVAFAIAAPYFRSPRNEVTTATLERLVARIKPGMTVVEISEVFGFAPDSLPREIGLPQDPTWTFRVTDRRSRHGNLVFYIGEFVSGRLTNGGLFYPI